MGPDHDNEQSAPAPPPDAADPTLTTTDEAAPGAEPAAGAGEDGVAYPDQDHAAGEDHPVMPEPAEGYVADQASAADEIGEYGTVGAEDASAVGETGGYGAVGYGAVGYGAVGYEAVETGEAYAADDAGGYETVGADETYVAGDLDPGPDWEDDLEPAPAAVGARAARSTRPRRPAVPTTRRPGPPRRRPPARRPPASAAPPAPPANRRGLVIALTVISVLVVGLGVGGLALGRKATHAASPAPPKTTPTTTSTAVTLPQDAFLTYKDLDTEFAFTIRYPRGWTRSEAPVKEIRLTVSDGRQFSARVRVTRNDEPTTPGNLANLKPIVEGSLGANVKILKNDTVNVNGLIGFRYIYTYTANDTGLEGAHVRYFLFQGRKMNDIIFEAVPSSSFDQIEGVFDQMLDSFHSDPE